MDCREFEEKVAAYIEGTLSGGLIDEMDGHRTACQKCARLAELHETMFAAFESPEPVRAPSGLADRILAAAEAEDTAADHSVVPFPINKGRAITCSTFERQVAAFVDGALDHVRADEMSRHRTLCTACARAARIHETVAVALNTAEPILAPNGMAECILEAAKNEEIHEAATVRIRFFEGLTAVVAGTGALVAAMVVAAGVIWSQLATEQIWLDKLYGWALAFFPVMQAWLVSVLPARWIAHIQSISVSVQLPFTSQPIPVYYLAPLLLIAPLLWHYLHTSSDETLVPQLY